MKKYLMVDIDNYNRKILCLPDEGSFRKALARFKLNYACREVTQPPSQRTIRRWREYGRCKAICGCWISTERGARCETHNVMSWLTAVYNIKG